MAKKYQKYLRVSYIFTTFAADFKITKKMEGEFVYRKRVADDLLELQLEAAGYVLVEGAKWCGKTTTALQQAHSVIFLDDPANKQLYSQMAEVKPQKL